MSLPDSTVPERRRAMPGAGHEDHVLVELLDEPVQVDVDECEAGARSPVTEQAVLDVLRLERLLQQRVVLQIDHPERQVSACSPVSVDFPEFLRTQWRSLNRGSRLSISAKREGRWYFRFYNRCHFLRSLFFPAVAVE